MREMYRIIMDETRIIGIMNGKMGWKWKIAEFSDLYGNFGFFFAW